VSGKFKAGFTFVELVIALALLALLAVVVVPRFVTKKTEPLGEFTHKLNVLLQLGYSNALATGKIHRVLFDRKNNRVELAIAGTERTASGELQFTPLASRYLNSFIDWPINFELDNFYINNKDELVGGPTPKVWFFIMPDGLAQEVIINMRDLAHEKNRGLVLNPFTVQFTSYDTYQKPS
jgi:prepilin-type N-terminal cleavage/methylation domain-containing protein